MPPSCGSATSAGRRSLNTAPAGLHRHRCKATRSSPALSPPSVLHCEPRPAGQRRQPEDAHTERALSTPRAAQLAAPEQLGRYGSPLTFTPDSKPLAAPHAGVLGHVGRKSSRRMTTRSTKQLLAPTRLRVIAFANAVPRPARPSLRRSFQRANHWSIRPWFPQARRTWFNVAIRWH